MQCFLQLIPNKLKNLFFVVNMQFQQVLKYRRDGQFVALSPWLILSVLKIPQSYDRNPRTF